jgi:hypothetical protein
MRRKAQPLIGFGITLLAVTTLAGCGGDDTAANGVNASSSSSSVTTESTTTVPTTATSGSMASTQTSIAATSPKRFLVDATALHVDGKDRLQFTFNDGTPGYAAEYVKPPITDEGQGKSVAISGDNVLKLAFESAATNDLTGGAKNYYVGQNRFSPTGTNTISEVVKVSEYEGRLLFGIGTRAQTPFTITSSGNILTVTFG